MTTVTGEKTITNTSAAVFAGESVLANRVFLYVRNLDDCIQIKINGRIVEPGEEIKLKFKASDATTVLTLLLCVRVVVIVFMYMMFLQTILQRRLFVNLTMILAVMEAMTMMRMMRIVKST